MREAVGCAVRARRRVLVGVHTGALELEHVVRAQHAWSRPYARVQEQWRRASSDAMPEVSE